MLCTKKKSMLPLVHSNHTPGQKSWRSKVDVDRIENLYISLFMHLWLYKSQAQGNPWSSFILAPFTNSFLINPNTTGVNWPLIVFGVGAIYTMSLFWPPYKDRGLDSNPSTVFCPLLKKSPYNPYLKFLDFSQLLVADTPMKFFFTPGDSTFETPSTKIFFWFLL